MKMNKITYICDICGNEMPHPANILPTTSSDYKYKLIIERQDMTKYKGAYKPPFKKMHMCEDCRKRIVRFTKEMQDAYEKN